MLFTLAISNVITFFVRVSEVFILTRAHIIENVLYFRYLLYIYKNYIVK